MLGLWFQANVVLLFLLHRRRWVSVYPFDFPLGIWTRRGRVWRPGIEKRPKDLILRTSSISESKQIGHGSPLSYNVRSLCISSIDKRAVPYFLLNFCIRFTPKTSQKLDNEQPQGQQTLLKPFGSYIRVETFAIGTPSGSLNISLHCRSSITWSTKVYSNDQMPRWVLWSTSSKCLPQNPLP